MHRELQDQSFTAARREHKSNAGAISHTVGSAVAA
jgi:hypothetical protein